MKKMRIRNVALIAAAATSLLLGSTARASDGDIVAMFKLSGPLPEQPSTNSLAALLGDHAPPTMFDIMEKLKKARTDDSVKAVIFQIDDAALGMAQIQELRGQFEALQAADKDVWVFSEGLTNGSLLLASAANHVVLVPAGEVVIHGIYAESLYFKNMLTKLGVEADILHCGDYKSAGEIFSRSGPSKEAEAQTNKLIDSMFENWIKDVAKSRKISPEAVRALVDKAILSSAEALEAKLVDKLMYREDFVESIKTRYDDAKVVSNYGGQKGLDVDLENPFAIFKLFGDLMKAPSASGDPAIAVVYVENSITSGKTEEGMFGGTSNAGSDTVRKAIAEAAADDSVKALVLRVDSPGGSALASDIMCEAAERFKKSGRPFVVSMGNVAASGGYYVSALADKIYADPSTITGSIGVVGGKMVTKGFWDWAGVTGHEYKRGQNSDIMNTNRTWDDDQRKVMMDMMNRIYGDFKNRVLQGRKDRIKGDLESLAGGRVYTGAQALEIGLVDELGGMSEAVKFAAGEAEISKYDLRVFPRPKSMADVFGEMFGGKAKEDDFVYHNNRGGQGLAKLPTIAATLDAVRAVDPQKAAIMQNFLMQVELLSNEGVLLVGPHSTLLVR
ncbi:MAG: signal peptide peptidase SppA [Planctomycetes bacterium]|nr:signal peptide peptidase SppA [Planctomycetota bacterium]